MLVSAQIGLTFCISLISLTLRYIAGGGGTVFIIATA